MSVREYSTVLTDLFTRVSRALTMVEAELAGTAVPLLVYRELVATRFKALATEAIRSLPNERLHGAAVSLQEYGMRNRDSILERIRGGSYAEVEDSHAKRAR